MKEKGNHPTPNEHDSLISPSPDPMGGIVLELTENVFGRVLRGLLRETPTRGEQTQTGSDGGAMDRSSIVRTSIRLTRTSRLRKLPSAGPWQGRGTATGRGCGAPNSHPVLAVLLPLLYLREKSHPAWLGMLPIFFLITPQFPKRELPGNPRSAPASANTSWSHGRQRRKNKKRERREATLVARLRLKSAPNWLSCHAAASRAHVPSSRRV
jgi:hypothetical protein